MGKKRLFYLTILYIFIFTMLFKLIYPSLEISSLIKLIGIVGLIFAFITNVIIKRIKRKD